MIELQIDLINKETLDKLQAFLTENPEDSVKLSINSDGGDLNAAFAVYDYIRTSDRVFYANIEGSCHSAAVVILLAVPVERRSANPLATSLIHQVYTPLRGDFNPSELTSIAEDLNSVNEKMATLYEERTLLTKEEALLVIKEEKERDANWLLEKGFISQINIYKNMKNGLFLKIKNLLGLSNHEVKDPDGNTLFTTEEPELKVGLAAEPDGEYEVPEVGTVVVKDGFIESITTKEEEVTEEVTVEELPVEDEVKEEVSEETPVEPSKEEELEAELADLKVVLEEKDDEIAELKEALAESLKEMKEFKATITSNYVPEKRITNYKEDNKVSTLDELRANKKFFK